MNLVIIKTLLYLIIILILIKIDLLFRIAIAIKVIIIINSNYNKLRKFNSVNYSIKDSNSRLRANEKT